MTRRAVITGTGVVCCAGRDPDTFARNVRDGIRCLSPISDSRVSHARSSYAGIIHDFDEGEAFRTAALSQPVDRYALLAIDAARQSLDNARIALPVASARTGIVFSTCSGPMVSIERFYEDALRGEKAPAHAGFMSRYYSAARILAYLFDIRGINLTVTTACSASTNALGIARDLVGMGILDCVLVGGADSFSITTLAGFDGLKATCGEMCAPFSKPVGMNLGEAGAFAVVEELESACRRGADVRAEITGYGSSNDAYHCTAPDPTGRGPALAMKRALENAGVTPGDITYVNGHGTGTEANDKAETKAMQRTFGSAVSSVPLSSIKPVTGHCLGAAGLLETIAALLCAEAEVLPPTAGYNEPREGCTLDYVSSARRPWKRAGLFMKNNFAFGGNNASLVMAPGIAVSRKEIATTNKERVVCISSIGIVSPSGIGAGPFCNAVTRCLADGKNNGGAGCRERRLSFELLKSVDRRLDLKNMDDACRFAAVAASLALRDGQCGERSSHRNEIGLFMNCGHGPYWAEEEHITGLIKADFHISKLTAFPYIVPNSSCGTICRALSLNGHNGTFCLGPGAGLLGIGVAATAVRAGHADLLLCGAADQVDDCEPSYMAGTVRPDGTDAGVMVLLEDREHARKRGFRVLGEICGQGHTVDTRGETGNDENAGPLADAVRMALEDAGLAPGLVTAVCCRQNDRREMRAVTMAGIDTESVFDIGHGAGYAPVCGSLMNLGYVLYKQVIENIPDKKYILTFYGSPDGFNAAYVVAAGTSCL